MSLEHDLPPEERLFKAALAFHPDEREAFIKESAGEDVELYEAVSQLLLGYEESGGDDGDLTMVTNKSARQQWAASSPEEPGTVIDHFRLTRKIGEGGMGVVWEAEQTEPMKRRVALKVIKLGMDTMEVVKRFERERQTLALMKHPNIAQVFEAGATELGRPYFVMELVEGIPITVYASTNGSTLDQRLDLFLDVCNAIEYAHQKGVIHRDLKPSNLLVARGQVKVIDFGVAKATQDSGHEETLVTKHTQVVGTPAYMSPEQATPDDGGIDTRADVYTLGVVLYELLTGQLPFSPERLAKTSLAEVQRILSDEMPPHPGCHVEWSFPKDLDCVVLKALAKDREARYPSVAALRNDLRRHLNGEAVLAAPPTTFYRLSKFVGRNRLLVGASSLIFLVVTAAAIISTYQAIRADRLANAERLARERSQDTLAAIFSQHATRHGEDGETALAALWSAQALELDVLSLDSRDRVRQSVQLWSHETAVPTSAFESPMEEIRNLEFHESERYLLAEQRDGKRTLWSLDTEAPVSLSGVTLLACANWSGLGHWLAIAHRDDASAVHVYQHGEWEKPFRTLAVEDVTKDDDIVDIAFNADDSMVAVALEDRIVLFQWEPSTEDAVQIGSVMTPDFVESISFSPSDPNVVAVASVSNRKTKLKQRASLFRWNPVNESLETVFRRKHHFFASRRVDNLKPVRFSKDGRHLTLMDGSSSTREIQRRDTITGEVVLASPLGEGNLLAINPSGDLCVCRDEKQREPETALIIDLQKDEVVARVHFNRVVTVAEFSTDGEHLLIAAEDGQVKMLSGPHWTVPTLLGSHQSLVMGVAFSPSGRFAATAQGGSLVRVWRLDRPWRSWLPLGHDTRVVPHPTKRAFALAGRSHVSASLRHAQVFGIDGQPLGPPLEREAYLLNAAFSPDGTKLVTAWSNLGTERRFHKGVQSHVVFWDWQSGERLAMTEGMPTEPRSVAWHPSGKQVAAVCAGGQFLLIDPETARARKLYQQPIQWPANYLVGNGEVFYTKGGQTLVGWGLRQEVHWWPDPLADNPRHFICKFRTPPIDVRVTQAGVVAGAQARSRSGDPVVELFEATQQKPLQEPVTHRQRLTSLMFDESETLLMSTSLDGKARVWPWQSPIEKPVAVRHPVSVYAGGFVPFTNAIITGGAESFVQIADRSSGAAMGAFRWREARGKVLETVFTSDGRHAIMGGDGLDGVGMVSLAFLHDRCPLPDEGLVAWAELNAGAEIAESSDVQALQAAEWLQRWKAFRAAYPEYVESFFESEN